MASHVALLHRGKLILAEPLDELRARTFLLALTFTSRDHPEAPAGEPAARADRRRRRPAAGRTGWSAPATAPRARPCASLPGVESVRDRDAEPRRHLHRLHARPPARSRSPPSPGGPRGLRIAALLVRFGKLRRALRVMPPSDSGRPIAHVRTVWWKDAAVLADLGLPRARGGRCQGRRCTTSAGTPGLVRSWCWPSAGRACMPSRSGPRRSPGSGRGGRSPSSIPRAWAAGNSRGARRRSRSRRLSPSRPCSPHTPCRSRLRGGTPDPRAS